VEIGADFTFFAVVAMFAALDTTGFALMSLVVCLIHECGHLIAMRKKPNSITFRGGGVRIESDSDSVAVLIAGSALNIVIFAVLWTVLPKTDIYPVMFAMMNLAIGLFNLLPVGCLDGKRLLSKFVPDKLLKVIEIAAIAAVIVVIAVSDVNFTILGVIFYVIAVDFFSRM
jgi:Zn-dependent protease